MQFIKELLNCRLKYERTLAPAVELLMKKFKQLALLLNFLILWGFGSQSLFGADEKCHVTALWDEWPPYQYADEAGEPTGFDIEITKAIFNNMSCDITFKQLPWARGILELKEGRIDIIMHADITMERRTWARFSDPYYTDTMAMFVRIGESAKYPFTSLEEIAGTDFRIGIIRGVYYGDEFEALMKDPTFRKNVHYTLDSVNVRHKMLKLGRLDAILRNVSVSPNLDEGLEKHPLDIYSSDQHVMFSRKSTDETLVNKFNTSLQNIVRTGSYDNILNKYSSLISK